MGIARRNQDEVSLSLRSGGKGAFLPAPSVNTLVRLAVKLWRVVTSARLLLSVLARLRKLVIAVVTSFNAAVTSLAAAQLLVALFTV